MTDWVDAGDASRLDDSGHVRCPAHGLRFRLSDGR